MDNKQESIRRQCQKLWIKAKESGEDIVLQFPDKTSAQRAKFALYESLRKTTDIALHGVKDSIELSVNQKLFTVTLRQRKNNPFYKTMEETLGGVLGGEQKPEPESEESRLQASLARFRSLKDSPDLAPARPRNPYFSREE